MRYKKLLCLFAVLAMFAMTGCAKKVVQKEWLAVGGSRADATVTLAVSWNPQQETPQFAKAQADDLAKQKCQQWGYSGAEPFGAIQDKCTGMTRDPFGTLVCYQREAYTTYMCLGSPSASGPSEPKGRVVKK